MTGNNEKSHMMDQSYHINYYSEPKAENICRIKHDVVYNEYKLVYARFFYKAVFHIFESLYNVVLYTMVEK